MKLDMNELRKNPNYKEMSGDKGICSVCKLEFSSESLRSFSKHLVCTGCVNMIRAICYQEEDKLD